MLKPTNNMNTIQRKLIRQKVSELLKDADFGKCFINTRITDEGTRQVTHFQLILDKSLVDMVETQQ